jgi:hypothetical protein
MIVPSQLALKTTQISDVLQPRNMRQTGRQIFGGKSYRQYCHLSTILV